MRSEIAECAGSTPSRFGGRNYNTRFHQLGGTVTSISYPQSRDDYPPLPSWPTYHGYTSPPDNSIQLQATLDKIMNAQLEMKDLINGLTSRVTKLEQSVSSTSSACSSSPETETKRVPPQLSVSNGRVFNINEYSIAEASCTNS